MARKLGNTLSMSDCAFQTYPTGAARQRDRGSWCNRGRLVLMAPTFISYKFSFCKIYDPSRNWLVVQSAIYTGMGGLATHLGAVLAKIFGLRPYTLRSGTMTNISLKIWQHFMSQDSLKLEIKFSI